jgi:U3 small nucleolar RNA-associated protein 21
MAASEGIELPSMQGTSAQEGKLLSLLRALLLNLVCTGFVALALEGLTSLGVIESPDVFRAAPQVDGELITLTLLPRARWQTLLNLDVITVRFILFPTVDMR